MPLPKKPVRRTDAIYLPANTPPPPNPMKKVGIALLIFAVVWVFLAFKRSGSVDGDFKAYLATHPQTGDPRPQEEWMNAKPDKSHLLVLFFSNPFRSDISVDYLRPGSVYAKWFTARRLDGDQWAIENVVMPDPEKGLI